MHKHWLILFISPDNLFFTRIVFSSTKNISKEACPNLTTAMATHRVSNPQVSQQALPVAAALQVFVQVYQSVWNEVWHCHGECPRILTPWVHSKAFIWDQLLLAENLWTPKSTLFHLTKFSPESSKLKWTANLPTFGTQLTSTLGWSFIGQKLRVRFCITYAGNIEECHMRCHVSWRIHNAA